MDTKPLHIGFPLTRNVNNAAGLVELIFSGEPTITRLYEYDHAMSRRVVDI